MDPVHDIERHYECKHYAQSTRCTFKTQNYSKDEQLTIKTVERMGILFIEGGAVSFTINDQPTIKADQDFSLFLDRHTEITIKCYQSCRISYFTFEKPSKLCDRFEIARLKPHAPMTMETTMITLNAPLSLALKLMITYHEDQLYCGLVAESKLKEILFILSAYYSPEELGKFLTPLLREEVGFKEFVITNFSRVNTVMELAELKNMPIRAFNKLFRDTFNMPPYQWILQQKGKRIEKRLAQRGVAFSEIIEEFGFSSASHFTVYCRRQFGMTPSQKRRVLLEEAAKKNKHGLE